jgi:undecaprenyl-diphosphatase
MSFLQRLQQFDWEYSQRLSLADQQGLLRRLAILFAHSGDSWLLLLLLGLTWLLGPPAWKNLALVMAAGIVLTAILVFAIKLAVRRQRPQGEWGAIYRKTDPHSFPSGHAARAFMLAMLAIGLGPAWLAVSVLVWAPLVTLARVAMGVHYLSDVVAGMLLGISAGAAYMWLYAALT